MVIWTVALMYRAFALSCNVGGANAAATFTVVLILAEAASKAVAACQASPRVAA